jgi:hypothetical protein
MSCTLGERELWEISKYFDSINCVLKVKNNWKLEF